MSDLEKILTAIREAKEKDHKIRLTEGLLQVRALFKNLTESDRQAFSDFAGEQVRTLLEEIPKASDFKEKDLCCDYGDRVLALYPVFDPSKKAVSEDVRALCLLLDEARPIDTAVRRVFERETVEDAHIDHLLDLARGASGEYERGKLYVDLTEHAEQLSGLPDSAKAKLREYLESDLERYLDMPSPDEDVLNAWEVAADVAKYFGSEKIRELLTRTLKAGHGNINFYAVESLIELGAPVTQESLSALAADLVYANLTYRVLERHGMASRFPAEYSSPEYLAKSDLIRWLTYPTELGEVPDGIEYIGKVERSLKKEIYYVFKFRSDSERLDDDIRGKWLIGWSSEEGGTFSNFDLLSDYERPTVSQTLKNIRRRLIGR